MKQSNIDYKHTYHFDANYNFKDNKNLPKEEKSSVDHPAPINTKINENPYRQNVEIEKDEIVLKPDFSAMHKAGGKKHSKGGTSVYLEPDTFVFSADKSLAITKEEQELFEFKTKGNEKPENNTPAKVLEKNVELEHYNRLVSILNDPKKDDLAKKSAAMMLEKYFEMIGNVAYIQEHKKDFPQGIPDFSMGTAPVYKTELKEDIMENKQYAKYGGSIENPYMQRGGWNRRPKHPDAYYDDKKGLWYIREKKAPATGKPIFDQQPFEDMPWNAWMTQKPKVAGWNTTVPNTTEPFNPADINDAVTGKGNSGRIPNPYTNTRGTTGTPSGSPMADGIYGYKGDRTYKQNASTFSDQEWQSFAKEIGYTGNNNKDFQIYMFNHPELQETILKLHEEKGWVKGAEQGMFDGRLGWRWDQIRNAYKGTPEEVVKTGNTPDDYFPPSTTETTTSKVDTLTPNGVDGPVDNGFTANWQFTPEQRRSQLYQGMKWASVEREMPFRSKYRATFADPMLLNPEQGVADMKGMAYQTMRASNTMSPIMGNAQQASISGQFMDKVPAYRNQIDNQNVGTVNQFRQYNNQVKNDETIKNVAFDQQYWIDAAKGRQNFNNMRGYMADKWMDTVDRHTETNQTLAWNLLTQDKPRYGFDFASGRAYANPKSILDVATDTKSDSYTQLAGHLMQKVNSGQELTKAEVDFFKALSLGKLPFSPSAKFKKGGKFSNPYRK